MTPSIEFSEIDHDDYTRSETYKSLPDILYKYRTWDDEYNRAVLKERQIFFASPARFNDPFDCAIPFRYDPSDMSESNIFMKLFLTGQEMFPDLDITDLIEKCYAMQEQGIADNWKSYYPIFLQQIKERMGVLSLSELNSNILMWSHYAGCHTGYCIGLNKQIIFDATLGSIGQVNYTDSFPFVPMFNNSGIITYLLSTKSKLWEYEREVRLIKIDAADKVFEFPAEAIEEVILGMNMKPGVKDEIVDFVSSTYPKARLYECVRNMEKFEVYLIPIIKKFS